MIKKLINLLPKGSIETLKCLFDRYSLKSYSQEGEDMILRRIFEKQDGGFYVDVGAHHPMKFSNTYFFYKRGWHGINIDAMPGSMKSFRKYRARDINIEVPVSNERKELEYFVFDEPALNGFDSQLSYERDTNQTKYKVLRTINLQTRPLSDILDEFLPRSQKIDFLSVDVEGLDLEVLKSNDWRKYKPDVVLVEVLNKSLTDLLKDDIHALMNDIGYVLYAKAVNSVIYKVSG